MFKTKTNDLLGEFNHYLFLVIERITMLISYVPCKLAALLHRVEFGKNVNFLGRTYFFRRRASSIKIGDNCMFNSRQHSNLIGVNHACMVSTLAEGATLEIGHDCGFSGTTIAAANSIVIGNNVLCGANTLITDTDWHAVDYKLRRTGKPKTAPVVIDDHVWLGYGSVVLKGVHIGEHTIIAPLSVVIKDVPANVLAGGNPCKIIKNLEM